MRLNGSSRANITGMDRPFAQGVFRLVAMGHYTEGPRNGQKCVAKWFKTGAVYEEDFFAMDIRAVEKAQVHYQIQYYSTYLLATSIYHSMALMANPYCTNYCKHVMVRYVSLHLTCVIAF